MSSSRSARFETSEEDREAKKTSGDFSIDSFFNGKMRIFQPRAGYRFSIDAVLLAHQCCPKPEDRVLDLGAGCGIVSLMLAHRLALLKPIWAVEIQTPLAALALRNVAENGMDRRIVVKEADLRGLSQKDTDGPFDLIVSNPPYRRIRSGRTNPDPQKAVARHEISATLTDVVAAARRLLKRAGRLVLIYPAERVTDLLTAMREGGVEPKNLRVVYSRPASEGVLVLAEGICGGRSGLQIRPPLVIYSRQGGYSREVQAMFRV